MPSPTNAKIVTPKDTFLTWSDDASRTTALNKYGADHYDGAVHHEKAKGSFLNTFQNIDTNVSVRDGFTRRDYDYFRPGEMAPWMQRDVIRSAMMAYDKVGLIRNVIDMMSDFTAGGIDVVHPVPAVQRLCRKWFKMVNGKERSERFMNTFYRVGNVVIKRVMATIPDAEVKRMSRIHAAKGLPNPDVDFPQTADQPKNQIPIRYTILNPMIVEVIGGELAPFVGDLRYGLAIPNSLITKIRNPIGPFEQDLIDQIPVYIRDYASSGIMAAKIMPLPPDRIVTMHYKKDDWQVWANPMIYAVLDDLMMLEKMKLADMAALDGIISQVRLWKLGNLEHKILPTGPTIAKLANILMNNVGGGVIDLIWGPELELVQTTTDAYKFLGKEKYEPVLNAIYDGLGIPPTMTAAGSAGGFTNNFISLRTLLERLNYGRDTLNAFWDKEFEILRQALNIKKAPRLRFSVMSLTDENAEKKIYVDMADRGLISDETLWERLKEVPDVEYARLMREQRARTAGRKPRKAGPWHKPEFYDDLAKIALQTGQVTPAEVGLELEENEPGQVSMKETMMKMQQQKVANPPNAAGRKGRPGGVNDQTTRKPRTVKTRKSVKGFVKAQVWSATTQKKIADVVTPIVLSMHKKKNLRQLTTAQAQELEDLKFGLLFNCEPYADLSDATIQQMIIDKQTSVPNIALSVYQEMINQFQPQFGRPANMDETRNMQASVYSLLQTSDLTGVNDE